MIRQGLAPAALMLGLFALMMTGGYWLRHDRAVWDDICWQECAR